MLHGLQKLTIRRPVATAMFYLALVLMGIISLSNLEVNLLPDLEFPRLTVVTSYPNASPEETENLVTRPLSEAVGTVSGIQKITSESLEGLSFITLQFDWGTNIDFAAMEVREKTDLTAALLPEDASKSVVTRFDPSQAPFMELVVFSRRHKNDTNISAKSVDKDLRQFLKKEVKVYLDRIDGVAMARFSGGYKKEILIDVDQARLLSHGLSLDQISGALDTSNMNYPAGHIKVGGTDVLVRTLGEFKNVHDITRTIIGENEAGTPIYLASLAKVTDGYKERTGLARYSTKGKEGRECVTISLYKEAGKNTVQVADTLKAELAEIRKRFAKDLQIEIVYDESRFIRQSINNIGQSLLLGGVLSFLALVLILRNLRSPLILVSILPISLLCTFILMYFRDISLNMMSLGGLALGIGMLFDSGNVVLAAIERNLRAGLTPTLAALNGAREVSASITTAVLTTVIVFLPIVFLKGIVGVVFAEMALTITFSLLVSLVVSLTLIPMLSSLRPPLESEESEESTETNMDRSNISRRFERLFRRAEDVERRLERAYETKLDLFLKRPMIPLALVGGLFMGALLFLPFLERQFMPGVDTGEFTIEVKNTRGATLASTAELTGGIEAVIREHTEVEHILTNIGYEEDDILTRKGGDVGAHRATLRVIMPRDRELSAAELIAELRPRIKVRDEISVDFIESGDVISRILSPESRAVALELSGADLETLAELGENIKTYMSQIPGIVGVRTGMEEKSREYHINFNVLRMAETQLSNQEISAFLKTAIKGSVATRLRVSDQEIDMRLRYQKTDRNSLADVKAMRVRGRGAGGVYISELVDVQSKEGYAAIVRRASSRVNRITADLEKSANNQEARENLEDFVERVKLPEGYRISYGGEKENIERSFIELGLAFTLAAVLIYMLLAAQFESFLYPLLMMGTVPLVLIGIIPALTLSGKSLNVNSFTGIILLIGIVVDVAVLFYEYTLLRQKEGADLLTAVKDSGKIILRPVLMNNTTTLLGLLPVALQLGEGTEFQAPLAIAVIGGLLAAVLLALFVIPVIFYYVLKWNPQKTH